jgi:hypothetical protein
VNLEASVLHGRYVLRRGTVEPEPALGDDPGSPVCRHVAHAGNDHVVLQSDGVDDALADYAVAVDRDTNSFVLRHDSVSFVHR